MTVIRAAVGADVPGIREVGHLAWPETYAFAGADYIAHGLQAWWSADATLRSMRDTEVLVAVDGDRVVGVGNVDLRGEVPIIWKLYVVPDQQGAGTGSALMTSLLELVPSSATAVRLEYVDGNDRAARFYARHGFREIGREPGERPGWPMCVWLERPLAPMMVRRVTP
ncbi:MAG TPA: GNAT family N-acetyltransferase [Actinomycetes bacterium]